MLQIRLSTVPSSEGGGGAKSVPSDSVTVACPDHLVLADLPVAKGLGSATASALVKTVGRKSRRHLGERVHFCVRCDFPIAIYGRLSPCEHAFCLDCARSDSICYLCDDRIQKIQTIKMKEGLYICAAPHCLKSFLKKSEFELHIQKTHADLLQSNFSKNIGNESEAVSAKQLTASETTARAPTKTPFSPNSTSLVNDNDDRSRVPQHRDQQPPLRPIMQPIPFPPPYFGQFQNHPSDSQPSNNPTPGFPANFPPFSYPPFLMEGAQPFYGISHEMARPDSVSEVKSDQGSLLGFSQPWNMVHGFPNMLDLHGRGVFFEGGDYRPNAATVPSNMPNPSTNKGMDMEAKGISAPQPLPFPTLPPMPPHQFSQLKQED